MAAKRLARTSGLDYAIMTGGDVTPLGGNAVTQLHQVRLHMHSPCAGAARWVRKAGGMEGTDVVAHGHCCVAAVLCCSQHRVKAHNR